MDYLYGIDLYNFAYWWECHEVFEGLWHVTGHKTQQGIFFQAIIQLAAANLKLFLGNERAAQNLTRGGLGRLQKLPEIYTGVNVAAFARDTHNYFQGNGETLPLIKLAFFSSL